MIMHWFVYLIDTSTAALIQSFNNSFFRNTTIYSIAIKLTQSDKTIVFESLGSVKTEGNCQNLQSN